MKTVAKRRPRPGRSFTPEFKTDIVERCLRGDRSVGQVAKDFDLTETAVRESVKEADVDAGERAGATRGERAELALLRQKNRRLREDVKILRRATASSPRRPGEGRPLHRGGGSRGSQRERCCELLEAPPPPPPGRRRLDWRDQVVVALLGGRPLGKTGPLVETTCASARHPGREHGAWLE